MLRFVKKIFSIIQKVFTPFTNDMQLLKWVGNKQRFVYEIVSYFPEGGKAYHEPFLGSGAVLGTLAPEVGYGSDLFKPLVDIWKMLRADPETLKSWYRDRWYRMKVGDKITVYEEIKASCFGRSPSNSITSGMRPTHASLSLRFTS